MTTWFVRIENSFGRVWYETREGEEELSALIESVYSNHPSGSMKIAYSDVVDSPGVWFVRDSQAWLRIHNAVGEPHERASLELEYRDAILNFRAQHERIEQLEAEVNALRSNLTRCAKPSSRVRDLRVELLQTINRALAPAPWKADIDDSGTPLANWTGKFYTGEATSSAWAWEVREAKAIASLRNLIPEILALLKADAVAEEGAA